MTGPAEASDQSRVIQELPRGCRGWLTEVPGMSPTSPCRPAFASPCLTQQMRGEVYGFAIETDLETTLRSGARNVVSGLATA